MNETDEIDETDETDETERDPLAEAASDLAADILSHARYEPVLERIVRGPPGRWVDVKEACAGFARAEIPLSIIDAHADTPLVATWFELPEASPNEGYCLVLFLVEEPLWSSSALLNRRSLLARLAGG